MKRLSLLIVLLILLISATAVLAAPADSAAYSGTGLLINGPDGQGDDIPAFLVRPVKSKFPPALECPTSRTSTLVTAPHCVRP